ncbi:hypothetical protein QQX98_000435 [Neonectria punicea]|uniref:Uncharacterized protein n=1 Tax=Neonectria punicea TaxID=979145 RepID=A0ABR1HTC6_9HYPO
MRTFFLAPAAHSTPLGRIQLGSIIEDPKSPTIAINNANSEQLRKLVAKALEVDGTDTSMSFNEGSQFLTNVFSTLLGGFANLNVGAGALKTSDVSSMYKIDKLKTLTISPSLGELKAVFDEPEIQESIKNSRFRSSVYMITDIRVAYGAQVLASTIRSVGGSLHFRSDLTPTGIPVDIGASVEAGKQSGQVISSQISDTTPFVIAYGLRELVYQRKAIKKQKVVKGEIMSAGEGASRLFKVEEDNAADYAADLCEVEEEDPDLPELWGMQVLKSPDVDGSDCQIGFIA